MFCGDTPTSSIRWRECVYVLQRVFLFFAFLLFFRPPQRWCMINMRQPFSGTAERIFVKLLPNYRGNVVFNVLPKWGLGPPNNLGGGAKNWKIAIGAYSSELITPKRKRISERLKRLWNHKKTMAYKVYVRPWPLTPRGKQCALLHVQVHKFPVLAILSKFSAVTLRQTFTVNSPCGTVRVWKILWTLTHKSRLTIRLFFGGLKTTQCALLHVGTGYAASRMAQN